MTLGVFQRTIVDNTGDTIGGATVEVRRESDGALVPLFSDRDGAGGVANPATAGPDGFLQFYAARGRYRIKATSGSYARTWRDVPLVDLDNIADPISEGARGDGVADDRFPIAKADGIAAAAGKALRFTFGTYLINSDLTIASDVIFEPGAKLKVPTGVTVTFSGAIHAGSWQVFDLEETGVIAPSARGQAVVDVRWFGAAWDGVTDDRAPVQAAWAAVRAAGGGIVQLPPGTGIIGDRPSGIGLLQLYGSNIWLRGAGRGATVLKRADSSEALADDHLILLGEGASNAASDIRISDLTIDGNRDNNTSGPLATHNIRIENAAGVLIDNVESRNGIYYGLHIRGEDAVTKRITVRDCYVHSCGRDCIDIKNQGGFNEDIVFDGVIAENPGLQGVFNDACFDFRGPFIASNLIARLPGARHHGIRIRGTDGSLAEGRPTLSNFRILAQSPHAEDDLLLIEGIQVKVTNGHLEKGGANGVQIQGARAYLSNIHVLDCDGDGFWLRDNTPLIGERVRLVGCLSSNNGGAGFNIDTDSNVFVACEARSNAGNGFESPAGAERNDFFGCLSSGNGGSDWATFGAASISYTHRVGTASYTLTAGGNFTLAFDSAFPTECLGVVASIEGDPIAAAESVFVDIIAADSFVARHRPNPGAVSRTIRYLAWGR